MPYTGKAWFDSGDCKRFANFFFVLRFSPRPCRTTMETLLTILVVSKKIMLRHEVGRVYMCSKAPNFIHQWSLQRVYHFSDIAQHALDLRELPGSWRSRTSPVRSWLSQPPVGFFLVFWSSYEVFASFMSHTCRSQGYEQVRPLA